jgi:hypothetical protein
MQDPESKDDALLGTALEVAGEEGGNVIEQFGKLLRGRGRRFRGRGLSGLRDVAGYNQRRFGFGLARFARETGQEFGK